MNGFLPPDGPRWRGRANSTIPLRALVMSVVWYGGAFLVGLALLAMAVAVRVPAAGWLRGHPALGDGVALVVGLLLFEAGFSLDR